MALLVVSKRSLDEEIKEMPEKECFGYLGISDWELQKSVLEKTRDGRISIPKDIQEEIPEGVSAASTTKSKTNTLVKMELMTIQIHSHLLKSKNLLSDVIVLMHLCDKLVGFFLSE